MHTSAHKIPLIHTTIARRLVATALLSVLVPAVALLQGCSNTLLSSVASTTKSPTVTLSPSSTSVTIWQTQAFTVSGVSDTSTCTWQNTPSTTLVSLGGGSYQAVALGTEQITVTCGTATATAIVAVVAQEVSGPITISKGGTYSGNWNSTDPNTPAVTIHTDDAVILHDSTITGRGRLIDVSGVKNGANVTIQNVTGTALDPQAIGMQRGAFVYATNFTSLTVKNCSMYGVSFGVSVAGAKPTQLSILNNFGSNLEDRASDGNGGLTATRPSNGHFVILNDITAASGAEVAWNQLVQTIGQSSTEDPINIYESQGTSAHPIWVHDNYLEGFSSPASSAYTGTGILTDGSSTKHATAFTLAQANQIVHTAGSGVAVASGHDNTFSSNRVVSCGVDSSGLLYAGPNSFGAVIWDYTNSGPVYFYNNTISGTSGGLIRSLNATPSIADYWLPSVGGIYSSDSSTDNDFTDPCFVNGTIQLQAEDSERAYWKSKLAANDELIGDQHAAS